MPFSVLRNPCPKVVRNIAIVLVLSVVGQMAWMNRVEPAPMQPKSLPLEARAVVIAQPVAAHLPPPPTLKFAVPANPFRQLDRIGLDGYNLRLTAETMGVDIQPVAALDLTGIDIDGIDASDRKCMTEAIYHEARNQDLAGQMAVADVILNRVSSRHYPDSICDVVYQGSTRVTGCQFSFTCDGSLNRTIERRPMVRSQILATAILGGFRLPLTGEALNYHAGYVSPYWAPTLNQTAKIGDHIFYKPQTRSSRPKVEKASLTTG